jgi:hypothetical protein
VLKVRVKVESDDNEEEESLDNDANEDKEEEEQPEEQPAQPVAQIEWLAYVAPRPDNILMDYNKSMFETLIPDKKVIRRINCWCYTNLLGRKQYRQMPDIWSVSSVLQQRTYRKALRKM